MNTGLCIGGPIDGEIRTATGNSLIIPQRIPINPAEWLMHSKTRIDENARFEKAFYTYKELTFSFDDPLGIWLFSDLKLRDAVVQVFRVYSEVRHEPP